MYYGLFCQPGDVDCFTFTLKSAGEVSLWFTPGKAGVATRTLKLTDAAGTPVLTEVLGTGKNWYTLPFGKLAAGTWIVQVSGGSGFSTAPYGIGYSVDTFAGTFTDVAGNAWYYNWVKLAYESGLMYGKDDSRFDPDGSLTLAEAIAMAARARSAYSGENKAFVHGDIWYQAYVEYAVTNGIIREGDFSDYDAAATREEIAYIFARALPGEAYGTISTTTPPDTSDSPYSSEILTLYAAGILSGSDNSHTFYPASNVTRAEAATIICRLLI
jgi:hypothetical protein